MNNTTADFFAAGDLASIEYSDVHGLWGGHVVRVLATDEVLVKWVSPAKEATERQFRLTDDEVRALFDLCVEHDLCTVTLEMTQLVVPDSTTYSLTLSNGRERRTLTVFAYQASDPRVAPILGALQSLRHQSRSR